MRRTLLALLSCASLAWLGLWWLGGERRGGAPQAVAEGVSPGPVAAAELAPPERVEHQAARAPQSETAATSTVVAPGVEATPSGMRLRGVLRFSGDGRPAPGEPLRFLYGESFAQVVTDAEGRFETEPVVSSGIVHASHAPADRARQLELEPSALLVSEPLAGERAQEFELTLVEPVALRVQVFANGVPAAAEVHAWAGRASGDADTDALGRCELLLGRVRPDAQLSLWANGPLGRSELVRFACPWPDEGVRLELLPTACVVVRVRDAAGRALGGWPVFAEEGPRGETDEQGLARLEPVVSGPRKVGTTGVAQEVLVPERGEIEVELLVRATELVAAGRVLDEDDQPLGGVRVSAENAQGSELSASASTDDDGRFELRAEDGQAHAMVRVRVGGGVEDAAFEPEQRLVPAGTRALVFHQLASADELRLAVAVLDERTHEPLERAQVLLFRAAWPDDWCSYGTFDGLQTCSLRPHDDARILARAPGYRDRSVSWAEVPAAAREGKPLRIELAPGFERELEVLDELTLEPLAGARILAANELVATTDVRGHAHLALDAWPASLRLEAAGHAGQEYDAPTLLCDLALSFRLARE